MKFNSNIEEEAPCADVVNAEVVTIEPSGPNAQSSPSPSSPILDADNTTSHTQDSNLYGSDTGGIVSYVVPQENPELKVVDALDVVPEIQIIKKGKKKRRILTFMGIFLVVMILLVVIVVVVLLTTRKRETFTVKDKPTNSPTQAPSASPTAAATASPTAAATKSKALREFLSTVEKLYASTGHFDTVFSNESSPQYRAATWVVDSVSLLGIDDTDDRMIRRFALATFYFSTNGDEWYKCGRRSTLCDESQEWLTKANECDWYAIECNEDASHVTKIFFPPNGEKYNGMSGTLPYELSFLSKLTVFIVSRGPISGTFPDWSKLSTLEQLYLNKNQFEGPFPTYILLNNPSIKSVSFEDNNFQGDFPIDLPTFGSPALTHLSVPRNNFTGHIVSQIRNLPSLKYLDISSNDFTGALPNEVFALTNLVDIDLSDTRLSGELTADLGAISQLIHLNASYTNLSGTLPTELFSLQKLRTLDLSFGNFSGTLSESFSNMTNLDTIMLNNNTFKGTIPPGFERLSLLQNLELHANVLSGSVSAELCDRRGEGFFDIRVLTVDCFEATPKVSCTCCTNC